MKLTAKSTGQVIWDAILDLHNQEQVVTREVLADITGLRMTVIDDHVVGHRQPLRTAGGHAAAHGPRPSLPAATRSPTMAAFRRDREPP